MTSRNLFEAAVPVFRRNQFGYNLGGPIFKNRTFFFHSFEGVHSPGGRGWVYAVESPQLRDLVLRTRPNSITARLLKDFGAALDPTYNFRDLGSPAPGVNKIGPADGIPDIGNAQYVPEAYRNGNQFTQHVRAVLGRLGSGEANEFIGQNVAQQRPIPFPLSAFSAIIRPGTLLRRAVMLGQTLLAPPKERAARCHRPACPSAESNPAARIFVFAFSPIGVIPQRGHSQEEQRRWRGTLESAPHREKPRSGKNTG